MGTIIRRVTALLLDHFGPGEKICKESTVGVVLMGGQFCEHVFQVVINPESVGFGGLYQTVHDGTGLGTTDRIHINPVLTANGERADGTFCRVVVHGNITVIQKDAEVRFLIQTVLQGFVGIASGGDGLHGFFYPCEIGVNFRRELSLTIVFSVFISGFIVKPVQMEQL